MPMRRALYLLAGASLLSAIPVVAAPNAYECAIGPEADAIVAQRERFNAVLDNVGLRGLDTELEAVLADDAVLITGTDSDVHIGRVRQIALWARVFTSDDRLIYVRTPACIDISSDYPIALEYGDWRGTPADGSAGHASGRYTAKWRRDETGWRIEVETYMTVECTPPVCPQTEDTP